MDVVLLSLVDNGENVDSVVVAVVSDFQIVSVRWTFAVTLKLYILLKTKLNEHALFLAYCSRQFTKLGTEKPARQQEKRVGGTKVNKGYNIMKRNRIRNY